MTQHTGMQPLLCGRRGLALPNGTVHPNVWDRVLCEGVPVSLRELVSLVTTQLGLTDTNPNRVKLLQCVWSLGWHVTSKTESGVTSHFWGGGVTPGTTSAYLRGDWVEVAGSELCRGRQTSRLARVICGIKVKNIKGVFGECLDATVDWDNEHCEHKDYVVYLLVRYAYAHPDTKRQRGPDCRPLCPGVLKNTHALWKWHERPSHFRRGCFRQRPWERHKHLFGSTPMEQNARKLQDQRAWYDVISVSNVMSHTNVQPDFDRPSSFLQSIIWC